MEKLVANKISAPKNIKQNTSNKKENNTLKKQKNEQNKVKNIKYKDFLKKIKKNSKFLIIFGCANVLLFLFLFLFILNNNYYNFLNRPKIISSTSAFVVLFVISALLNIVCATINLFCKQKLKAINKKIAKQNCKDLKPVNKKFKYKFKKMCTTAKKQIKYAYKKRKTPKNKQKNSNLNLFIVLLQVVLCFCFKLKVLWLCVFCTFAICVFNVLLFGNRKTIKAVNIIMLLANLCLFFSFYVLYLLN